MSFKIVKTIEDGTIHLSSVPSAWERNGILYWPPKGFKEGDKLIKDPESIPRIDWAKIPCTVKETDIETLNTANKLCKLYSNFDDTDAEVDYFQRQKGRKKQMKTSQTNIYNNDIEIIETNIGEEDIETNNNSAAEPNIQDNEIIVDNSNNNNTVYVMSYDDISNANTTNDDRSTENRMDSKLEIINQKIDSLDTKLDFFIKNYSEIKTLLIELLQNKSSSTSVTYGSGSDTNNHNLNCESNITEFVFPLNKSEEVEELDLKLTEKEFQYKMFRHFNKIAGTSGKQDGDKVTIRLIKELFSNALLCQYTWKGISTSKNDEHKPTLIFVKYGNLLKFLFSVLEKADKTFTKLALEKFLQYKIFKRNTQRLKREIMKKRKLSDWPKQQDEERKEGEEATEEEKTREYEGEMEKESNMEVEYVMHTYSAS